MMFMSHWALPRRPELWLVALLLAALAGCATSDSGVGEVRNPNLSRLQAKAEGGDAKAQSQLGLHYLQGLFPPKYDSAAIWFLKAAEQGYAEAQWNLGSLYEKGQGLPQNKAEAEKWFRLAESQGWSPSQRRPEFALAPSPAVDASWSIVEEPKTGSTPAKTPSPAVLLAEPQGDARPPVAAAPVTQVEAPEPLTQTISLRISDSPPPTQEVESTVATPVVLAAENSVVSLADNPVGDSAAPAPTPEAAADVIETNTETATNQVKALSYVATPQRIEPPSKAYASPRAQTQEYRDYQEAMDWLRKEAADGDAEAQYSLGLLHANGQGVPKDDREALRWFLRAASKGWGPGETRVGVAFATGQGTLQDYKEAFKWLFRAAEHGEAEAQYQLGLMYANATGTTRDLVEACKWYNLAAGRGHVVAGRARDNLRRKMTPEQIDTAQRRAVSFEAKILSANPTP